MMLSFYDLFEYTRIKQHRIMHEKPKKAKPFWSMAIATKLSTCGDHQCMQGRLQIAKTFLRCQHHLFRILATLSCELKPFFCPMDKAIKLVPFVQFKTLYKKA